jgi:hypothetical protein
MHSLQKAARPGVPRDVIAINNAVSSLDISDGFLRTTVIDRFHNFTTLYRFHKTIIPVASFAASAELRYAFLVARIAVNENAWQRRENVRKRPDGRTDSTHPRGLHGDP